MAKDNMTDKASDETVRAYLQETLEHLLAAGHSTYELVEFALDKFGRKIIPHLNELQEDIQHGRVQIQRMAESAKTAVFGLHVSPEQREALIREAAYLRAERRSFTGGSHEEDWLAAELEVDQLLTKQNGLLDKGLKNIESVSVIARHELTEVKNAVSHWRKARGVPVKKAG